MLDEQLLQDQADLLMHELIDAMLDNNQRATGRTIAAIRNELTRDGMRQGFAIYGPHHVGALEYGRKPTSQSGDGSLYQKILEWVRVKAGVIRDDGVKQSKYTLDERIAKRITYFIHTSGTYLYRKGETYNGKKNPISRVFTDERIEAIAQEVGSDAARRVSSELLNEFKTLSQ